MKKPFSLVRMLALSAFCIGQYSPVHAHAAMPAQKPSPASKRLLYGTASFYANKFNGRQTASGEIFSQNKLTCACNAVPLGTWIKVTNMHNGRSVVVKVNDRLHPKMRRIVDLTKASAISLGYKSQGIVRVKVEVLGKTKPAQV